MNTFNNILVNSLISKELQRIEDKAKVEKEVKYVKK